MDTWELLEKELSYYGIELIDNKRCRIFSGDGKNQTYGVIRSIKETNKIIKKQKKILLLLWNEIIEILQHENFAPEIIDEKMINLFIFSLKDLAKFLLCFEGYEKSKYHKAISIALTRDINSFDKQQIYKIPDYKISIDWVHRTISKLLYICKLLAFASMGRKRIAKYEIKTARGISGPWAHLDLPMEERVFPFGQTLQDRTKGKQMQRRYRKGLANYNNDGRVGEGHYWRELRNEPFSWADRAFEDPYPSRSMLSR